MKIRFLPFLIYVCIFSLVVRIEAIFEAILNKEENFISLIKINELNAKQEEKTGKENNEVKSEKNTTDAQLTPIKPESFNCSRNNFSESDLDLLQNLSKRREELDRIADEHQIKEALFKADEAKLEKKIAEMKALKSELSELLSQYNKKEDMKINSLVKIYENMKPKEAAKIFNALEMPLLLEVLDKMKESKAAPIMAQMDYIKATEITKNMLSKRRLMDQY